MSAPGAIVALQLGMSQPHLPSAELQADLSGEIAALAEHVVALSRHRPDPVAHVEIRVPRGLPVADVIRRLKFALASCGLGSVGVSAVVGDVRVALETVEFYR